MFPDVKAKIDETQRKFLGQEYTRLKNEIEGLQTARSTRKKKITEKFSEKTLN